jgi:triosephosphate isomerase
VPASTPDLPVPIVVGNWKMNGVLDSLGEIERIAKGLDDTSANVGLALPATLIALATRAATRLTIGAQDVHPDPCGPRTGGIAATMLRDAGARFTLVGHSERRLPQGSDDDDRIASKLNAARDAGLSIILCVGETAEAREAGRAAAVVAEQLRRTLPDTIDGRWLAVAYEPRWAIGSGMTPSLDEIAAMHRTIRTVAGTDRVPLLYGGSVSHENARDILSIEAVDGLLVGNASLTAERFVPIVRAVF